MNSKPDTESEADGREYKSGKDLLDAVREGFDDIVLGAIDRSESMAEPEEDEDARPTG